MKYTVKHTFDYPLAELLAAREERYKYLDKFPELKNVTLLDEKKEGNKIFQKRQVSLMSSLPVVLQPLLKDTGLIEESVFDTQDNTHIFTFTPPGNAKIFVIKGKSTYRSISEKQSERIYEVEVKSETFLVSGAIEAAIEGVHKHSLDKDKNSILKFLSEKPV
ncbi:MAG: DUF2505 family protein [Leptospiraceae bacterium]|nr:DUF2505 family protein [Leptospiraceae bacterium]